MTVQTRRDRRRCEVTPPDPRHILDVEGVSVISEEPVGNLPGSPFRITILTLADGNTKYRCRDCIFVDDTRGGVIRHRNAEHGKNTGRKNPPHPAPENQDGPDIFSAGIRASDLDTDDTDITAGPTPPAGDEAAAGPVAAELVTAEPVTVDVRIDAEEPASEPAPELTEQPPPTVDRGPWSPLGVVLDALGDRSAMDLTVGDLVAIAPSAKALVTGIERLESERNDAVSQLALYRSTERLNAHKIEAYDGLRDEVRVLRTWKRNMISKLRPLGFVLTEEDSQQ